MGLLKHLLFWPVTGPKFLIDFSMGKVEDVVKEELTDDAPVKSALLELQLQLELGDIDDDEYVRREAELMRQLRDIREWREQFGMGVSGGPVRVQSAESVEAQVAPAEAEEVDSPALRGQDDAADGGPRVARPGEATIEFNLDWDG
jgi:hypothetical protein